MSLIAFPFNRKKSVRPAHNDNDAPPEMIWKCGVCENNSFWLCDDGAYCRLCCTKQNDWANG